MIAMSQGSTVKDFKARINGKFNVSMSSYHVSYQNKLLDDNQKISSFYDECGEEEVLVFSRLEVSYRFFDSEVDEVRTVKIPLDFTVGQFKELLRMQGMSNIYLYEFEYNSRQHSNEVKFASFWKYKENREVSFIKPSIAGL